MPKTRLNQPKKRASGPRVAFLGLRSIAQSAGLNDKALNAEMITEIAMVTANCWYSRPVMPGMKAVGMNTADRINAMAITGPETSSIAFNDAALGDSPFSM